MSAFGYFEGRKTEGGKFDFKPESDVPANTIVRPSENSPAVGVTEIPVHAGKLGTLAQFGDFRITKPDGLAFSPHDPIYAVFTGIIGSIVAPGTENAVLVGMANYEGSAVSDKSVTMTLKSWS